MEKKQQIKPTMDSLLNWRNVIKSNFTSTQMMADLIKYPVITEKTYL